MVKNCRKEQNKLSKMAKKTQIWIFKKRKKHNKQEIQDMGVALSCHALLRKLQLLNLKLYD